MFKNSLLLIFLLSFSSVFSQCFTRTEILSNVDGAQGIVSHDFNQDGINEIVVAQFSADLVSLFSESNGQFSSDELLNIDGPIRLGVGDFNLDGLDDIIVTSSNESGIYLLTNEGNLEFTSRNLNSADFARGRSLSIADMDNDNDLDIVVASPANDRISLFEMTNSNPVTFSVSDIDTNLDNVGEVTIEDFDNNGLSDIVTCARFGGSINTYTNLGNLSFGKTFVGNLVSPIGNTTGDFNNDGRIDLAIADLILIFKLLIFFEISDKTPGLS